MTEQQPIRRQWTQKTMIDSIPVVQDAVCELLREQKLCQPFIGKMKLVLGEAIANAVEHGGGGIGRDTFRVTVIIDGDSLQMQIEDFQGRMFDPEYFRRIAAAKDWGKGGRGIMLLEAYMDHVSYLIDEGSHTVLFLEKTIKGSDRVA